jgi:hypothetical protein
MRMISLRAFAAQVSTLVEPVEVSRRDREGNIQILGYWTPYATVAPDATPLEPLVRETERTPGPRMIHTPQEAAAAVTFGRSQPAPKPTKRR